QLLRYQLYETNARLVPLEKELEHLHHLLDLHRLRLPNPELLTLEVSGHVEGKTLPPMLLMPLAENMFKHGLATAPMHVHLSVEPTQLTFSTHNTHKPKADKNTFGGIGLQNLRRRLNLLYPGSYELKTTAADNTFTASLTLK